LLRIIIFDIQHKFQRVKVPGMIEANGRRK